MKIIRIFPIILFAFLFVGGFLAVIQVYGAPSTGILVDTLADEIDDDGYCSLREAIIAANDNSSINECPAGESGAPDTITFSVGGTISLTGQLSVGAGGPLVIDGGDVITVSGHNQERVFYVGNEAQLTLENITVADGFDINEGGGIMNYAALTITNSTFSGNRVEDEGGGGIDNRGILNIADSTFSGNSADRGGGIINYGTLTIADSTFSDNTGGAIHNEYNGMADITGSTFTDNTGGGIRNWGSLNMTNSILSENSATYWGGIFNSGTISVTHSTFSNNSARDYGGGIRNGGTAKITESIFSDNSADNGGGITNFGTMDITHSTFYSNTATDHYGGGLYNDYDGTLTIANSTLSGNSAGWGGGIDNRGTFTLTASTLSGNSAVFGGGSYNEGPLNITDSTFSANTAAEFGGGISNWTGTVNISYSTFSGNSAPADGGGALDNSGALTITNSILADSSNNENCNGNNSINDGGYNLEDADTCSFVGDSLSGTDPLLAPLGENGGPTWTHALMQGSPAIDSADPASCPSTDQRGAPRPFDGDGDGVAVCDRGSFEAGYRFPTTTTITGETFDPSYANQPFTVTFAVTSTFGTPSGDVFVMASDSEGGCFDELTEGLGSCQLTLSAAGTYTVTAAYFGNDNYSPSSDSVLHDVIQLKLFLPLTIRAEQP